MTKAEIKKHLSTLTPSARKRFLDDLLKSCATVRTPKKPSARKPNPVKEATREQKVQNAMRLFERFRLEEPRFVDEVDAPICDVAMVIGHCDGVLYTTVRDGKTEKYVHDFAKKSRPILAASWDGKQLFILGGRYNFTQDGITDY